MLQTKESTYHDSYVRLQLNFSKESVQISGPNRASKNFLNYFSKWVPISPPFFSYK